MSKKHPIDYETPEPRRRVGFLSKLNPKATHGSVARATVGRAAFGAALWLVGAYNKPAIRDHWHFTLPAMVLIGAVVGAAWEWQVNNDDHEKADDAS